VPNPLRVLFAASEMAPLTKTGGLADVAAALPLALSDLGLDVCVLLPGYREVLAGMSHARTMTELPALGAFPAARLLSARAPSGTSLIVLACPELYEREGGPYLDPTGRDWPDNPVRFGLLSYVAFLLGSEASPCNWRCDVLHCNDWQCGLAPAYAHWSGRPHAPSLMTIHNLAYQGNFPASFVSRLGLPAQSFDIEGVEYHGQLSFLKAGLYYADRISTVSPTYAVEIQSEPLGFGMHGLLTARSASLVGILNGIDEDAWNPTTDPALAANYDAARLADKARNKTALRRRFDLDLHADAPLLGIVSRLIPQKGIDLVAACAERLLALPAQLIVLGTGDASLEQQLAALARAHRGRFAFIRGFDEALSHLIEAGADIFLMPSRFEPCGLNQMYSQRYGTLPVVHRTGGLADSVVDCTPTALAVGTATGFVFDEATSAAFFEAVGRAVAAWRDPQTWRALQRNAMARNFGWTSSAGRYVDLYGDMIGARSN
jgi:starch synthase